MKTYNPVVRAWIGGIVFVICCTLLIVSHRGYGLTTSITSLKSYQKIYPEFIKTAMTNDINAMKSMLAFGANPNEQSFEGTTALHWACRNGDSTYSEEMIHVLIDAGAQVYLQDENGYEPLHYTFYVVDLDRRNRYIGELVASGGNPNALSRLIEATVYQGTMDPRKGNESYFNPGSYRDVLEETKGRRKFSVLDLVVNNFDRTGLIATLNAWGVLFYPDIIDRARDYAYESGFRDIAAAVESYQQADVGLQVIDDMIFRVSPSVKLGAIPGITPLMEAIIMRDEKRVKELVDKKANIQAVSEDRFKQTALHLAIRHRNYPIIEMLVKGGARVDVGDYLGNTPLHVLARTGDNDIQRRCTPLLVQAGAKLYAVNNVGDTVLSEAIRMHDKNYIGYLLSAYPSQLGQRTWNTQNANAIELANKYRMPDLAEQLKRLPR